MIHPLPPYVTQPIHRQPADVDTLDEADNEAAQAPARPASMLGAALRAVGSTLTVGVEAYARAHLASRSRAPSAKTQSPPCTPCAARALVAQAKQVARGRR